MNGTYRVEGRHGKHIKRYIALFAVLILAVVAGIALTKKLKPTPVAKAVNQLQFDNSVSELEKQTIKNAMKDQLKTISGSVGVSAKTVTSVESAASVISTYVPVGRTYSTIQSVNTKQTESNLYISSDTDKVIKDGIAGIFNVDPTKLAPLSGKASKLNDADVAFIPAAEITPEVTLLSLDGKYYLDSFTKGAFFRQVTFTGGGASSLKDLKLNTNLAKSKVLKVNQTGVTALTRVMMKKLSSVGDSSYFSKKIGPFLADADITHVSNEVSFQDNCQYSNVKFCAPPKMIDALKDSGVDVVELTGNHNNDTGNIYNTQSINLYKKLGWGTFGGGLNTVEAAKPYQADKKGSKVAFLGYNYPDGPNSGAVATPTTAGANHFDIAKVKTDIAEAKKTSDFVIVDIQFWECYAYPDGYTEFPECDGPIADQKETFRAVADLGADMVVGSSAHQPQTYELYKGTPIYYGLGNLYFEQNSWPGTERGIILTHYLNKGKLIQTRLSPTVYDKALQTRLMTASESKYLLGRLDAARPAGL